MIKNMHNEYSIIAGTPDALIIGVILKNCIKTNKITARKNNTVFCFRLACPSGSVQSCAQIMIRS